MILLMLIAHIAILPQMPSEIKGKRKEKGGQGLCPLTAIFSYDRSSLSAESSSLE